jgi:hypothetical protein
VCGSVGGLPQCPEIFELVVLDVAPAIDVLFVIVGSDELAEIITPHVRKRAPLECAGHCFETFAALSCVNGSGWKLVIGVVPL